ncbi:MAG: AMP-binding protein [Chitinispirillales bacterium]|jgi:phenylacetate-CoA ligase|nr:AMP-binding protein [Chitinispirillales bacterium]
MSFLPEYSWEFLSEDEIESRSLRAMQNHINYLKENSVYYEKTLSKINGEDIKKTDDILKLPFTNKDVLSSDMKDFYCCDSIAEVCITSGSTGRPLVMPFTKVDLDRLTYNESMSFNSIGITSKDSAQIMVSLDRLFVAGMAYYRGMVALGVNTARIGCLPLEMQGYYIRLLRPSVIVGVPSYFIKLAEFLKNEGKDVSASSIQKLICIGEPLRNGDMSWNDTAQRMEDLYDAKVYCTYASTETCSSYCDCLERTGGHSHPELIYTEIIDDNGNPVPDGEIGELVVSTFGMEALPLLRYRTGDMTFKVKGKCPCGRNSVRIGPIVYRKSQLIKIKGTTIYPATINNVIDSLGCCDDYIVELRGQKNYSEKNEIIVHIVAENKDLHKITQSIAAAARVKISVFLSNKSTIAALRGDARKAIRFVDNRK